MPFTTRDGIRLYWKLEGSGDRPPLVLLNSIGTDMSLWDRALQHLLPAFRLLRIDTRGHGASDAPEGDYSLTLLAGDVSAIMGALSDGIGALWGAPLRAAILTSAAPKFDIVDG